MLPWLWALLSVTLAHAWLPPQLLVLNPQAHSRTKRQNSLILTLHGWSVQLTENTALKTLEDIHCNFYTGVIINEVNSSVAVTECNGDYYGLLQVDGTDYVVQPNRFLNGTHVLHRRDVNLDEHTSVFNLTLDTVFDLELNFDDEPLTPAPRGRSQTDEVEFFREPKVIMRPLDGDRGLWLEMALVADHTVVKFHGQIRVKHYILAVMNIVSAIFNEPSLDSNLTIVINKLYLYEEKDNIIQADNMKRSLEGVNKWNYKQLMKLSEESSGWDVALWMTRVGLSGASGYAPVGGVCTRTRSAAINKDQGLTSAFVIAHELAHLLGLGHDGMGECEDSDRKGFVMAPVVIANLHQYAWSPCSKKQFYHKAKYWYCLHERSEQKGLELKGMPDVGAVTFSMDEQCRMEFGEGFGLCKSLWEAVRYPCERLHCASERAPHVCKTKDAPPLEGTPCGQQKDRNVCLYWSVPIETDLTAFQDGIGIIFIIWHQSFNEHMPEGKLQICVKGECSTSQTKLKQEVGQWGDWNPWSACDAPCGYGIRVRNRTCIAPADGECEGASEQASTCWSGRVCLVTRDIRSIMCRMQYDTFVAYLPADVAQRCEAWCVEATGGAPVSLGPLPDGAPCSYDHPHNICYQGSCVFGRCNQSDQYCHDWCHDGSCTNNTLEYHRKLRKGWTRLIVIPHEARRLSIQILSPVSLKVALKERGRHSLEFSNHQTIMPKENDKTDNIIDAVIQGPENDVEEKANIVSSVTEDTGYIYNGSLITAGTSVSWIQTSEEILVSSTAPLSGDLMLLVSRKHLKTVDDNAEVKVLVNYSLPVRRPQEYRVGSGWRIERGPCSVSCGGGRRWARARCRDRKHCPPPWHENCNTHSCENWRWVGGDWEHCSTSCGDTGYQERQLFCVPAHATASTRLELVAASVSPALCSGPQPERVQSCNRFQCPVYWQELPWTPCSATCGRGISVRPLVCPAKSQLACGPKPTERRKRCKEKKCPRSDLQSGCKRPDASRYCELFVSDNLLKSCSLPAFKKICCNACTRIEQKPKEKTDSEA